jgi:hypothetical protein
MLCYVAQSRRAASGEQRALFRLLSHVLLLNLVGLPQAAPAGEQIELKEINQLPKSSPRQGC